MLENSNLADSLSLFVTSGDGIIKNTRFVKALLGFRWEFVPNNLCLKLINQGHIKPNTWKVPFLFGRWTASKE